MRCSATLFEVIAAMELESKDTKVLTDTTRCSPSSPHVKRDADLTDCESVAPVSIYILDGHSYLW
jgi:hypothetical protein